MFNKEMKHIKDAPKCAKIDCLNCVSQKAHFFSGMPDETLREINRAKISRRYKRGDEVFHAGDVPIGIICISHGVLRVEALTVDGKPSFLRLAKGGEILGYRAVFANEPYHVSAIAHEDSEVCLIPKEVYMKISLEKPELMLKVMERLSVELREAEMRIESVTHKETFERVIETVIYFLEKYPEQKWTRKEIADWAGTTPETVMRVLAKIEDQGLIEQVGRLIKIVDREKLLEMAAG